MRTVPVTLRRLIVEFAPVFSKRVWEHVQVLVVGALLAPGKRTVTAVLQGMGLGQERQFQRYPRVLNRARWSSLAVARGLLGLVVQTCVATGAYELIAYRVRSCIHAVSFSVFPERGDKRKSDSEV